MDQHKDNTIDKVSVLLSIRFSLCPLYYDTPLLLQLFPPLAPHTLFQRQAEHILNSCPRLGRTLDIPSTNFFCNTLPLLCRYWCLALCTQHPSRLLVPPEINFRCDKYEGCSFTKMCNFREPLVKNSCQMEWRYRLLRGHTLSCTLPRLTGKSIENTMRMTSLSG